MNVSGVLYTGEELWRNYQRNYGELSEQHMTTQNATCCIGDQRNLKSIDWTKVALARSHPFSSSLTRLMTSICTPISLGQIALDLERKSGINYASDKEDEY